MGTGPSHELPPRDLSVAIVLLWHAAAVLLFLAWVLSLSTEPPAPDCTGGFCASSRHLGLVFGLVILGPGWVASALFSALIRYGARRRIRSTRTAHSVVVGIVSSAVGTLLGGVAVVTVGVAWLALLNA
jgi:hypothetical protein